jgi:hypothetical protein
MEKETYCYGKRDLLLWQKRPINMGIPKWCTHARSGVCLRARPRVCMRACAHVYQPIM